MTPRSDQSALPINSETERAISDRVCRGVQSGSVADQDFAAGQRAFRYPASVIDAVRTATVTVIAVVMTATAIYAQDITPPFLEPIELVLPSTLSSTEGVTSISRTVFLEAGVFGHLNAIGCGLETGSISPCLSGTIGMRIRMENEDSLPICSPSYMSRLNMQVFHVGDESIVSYGSYFGHHSNGKKDCLFLLHEQCVDKSELDFGNTDVRADNRNGNFSLN